MRNMKKLIFSLILILILLTASTHQVKAASFNVAGASAQPKERFEINADPRVIQLEKYLKYRQSPLVDQAAVFIQIADKYGLAEFGLDYLVPSITGVESSFGKHYPQGSYNAYGWNSGNWYFDSWEDSIDHVTRVLRGKYIDRGADTVWKIGPIYAESPTWAQRVNFFMNQIESFDPVQEKLAFTL